MGDRNRQGQRQYKNRCNMHGKLGHGSCHWHRTHTATSSTHNTAKMRMTTRLAPLHGVIPGQRLGKAPHLPNLIPKMPPRLASTTPCRALGVRRVRGVPKSRGHSTSQWHSTNPRTCSGSGASCKSAGSPTSQPAKAPDLGNLPTRRDRSGCASPAGGPPRGTAISESSLGSACAANLTSMSLSLDIVKPTADATALEPTKIEPKWLRMVPYHNSMSILLQKTK